MGKIQHLKASISSYLIKNWEVTFHGCWQWQTHRRPGLHRAGCEWPNAQPWPSDQPAFLCLPHSQLYSSSPSACQLEPGTLLNLSSPAKLRNIEKIIHSLLKIMFWKDDDQITPIVGRQLSFKQFDLIYLRKRRWASFDPYQICYRPLCDRYCTLVPSQPPSSSCLTNCFHCRLLLITKNNITVISIAMNRKKRCFQIATENIY